MREALALIAREWRLLRPFARPQLVVSVAVATIAFLGAEVTARRSLIESGSTRTLLSFWVAFSGALISYQSFMREMRQGTWDGLLLLRCSRGLLLATKLGVGLVLLAEAVLVPMLSLEAMLALSPATGGPVPTVYELLTSQWLIGVLLVGVVAHLAMASAALMDRERLNTPVLLVVMPMAAFVMGDEVFAFVMGDEIHGLVVVGPGLMIALLLVSIVLGVAPGGRRVAPVVFAARAFCLMPACLLALMLTGHVAQGILPARPRDGVGGDTTEPAPLTIIDELGQIVSVRRHRRHSDMLAVEPLLSGGSPSSGRSDSRWVWRFFTTTRTLHLFAHRSGTGVLTAYDRRSGLPAGCVGRGGLEAASCEPLGEPLRELDVTDGTGLVTPQAVFILDDWTERLRELHRGDIRGAVTIQHGVAIQSGPDLLMWIDEAARDGKSNERWKNEELPPERVVLSLRACRGVAGDGLIRGLLRQTSFIGVRVMYPASRRQELVVCRDGEVTERRDIPYAEYSDEDSALLGASRAGSGVLQAALGPALSSAGLPRYFPGPFQRRHPSTEARVLSVAVTAAGVAALLVTFAALRRQRIPASVRALSVAGGLVLGPAFSLACVLLLAWRRRASGAMRAATP